MEVLDVDVEKEEVGNEDPDNDGEQLDQDMTNVINDTIREVCMDNPADIQSDIQKLASIVSDGVKDRLSALHSTLDSTHPNVSTTQNHNQHCPILELHYGTFIRKTTAVWLFQEGERVSSDRLFRVRAKQPFLKQALLKTHHQL